MATIYLNSFYIVLFGVDRKKIQSCIFILVAYNINLFD
jgi:hypothetical protein